MAKKRILYLQPTFDTHGPRNIRSANIIEHLKENYSITVLCLETYETERYIEGVRIIRIPQSFLGKYIFNKGISNFQLSGLIRFFSRAFSYVFSRFIFPDVYKLEHANALAAINKEEKFDIIIASMVPFSNAILAYSIQKKYAPEAKVVLDIGDPLAKNSARKTSDTSKMVNFEQGIALRADAIVVTNIGTKAHYVQYGCREEDVFVIPQGVDVDRAGKIKPKEISLGKPNLIYAGSFYPGLRDYRPFVAAVNDLKEIGFVIEIYGPTYDMGFAHSMSLVNVLPRISNDLLFQKYSESDILLYFDNAFGFQTSGKIYELLAIKKPILFIYSNDESPVLEMIREFKHIIYAKNTESDIAITLNNLKSQVKKMRYDYALEPFSWETKANSFNQVLLNL